MAMTDRPLTDKILAKLRSGELPMPRPPRAWGGRSTGGICAACDDSIGKETAEIEADGADGRTRLYHVGCFAILERMRTRSDCGSEPSSS